MAMVVAMIMAVFFISFVVMIVFLVPMFMVMLVCSFMLVSVSIFRFTFMVMGMAFAKFLFWNRCCSRDKFHIFVFQCCLCFIDKAFQPHPDIEHKIRICQ